VKTNKSDYLDAQAMAEAVERPNMRFVPIKTEEQLDLQAVHRVRERWVRRRTAVVNQIRGLPLERALTLPKGRWHVDNTLPDILEDATFTLSGSFRMLLAQLKLELDQLAACIEQMDTLIQKTASENEACQRLTTIPGIGPVTATALVAAVGNASGFRKGRDLAAWVGMVPREYSTGGKQRLLGISKRGNRYLRRLFVQGARVVMQYRHRQASGLNSWLDQLLSRAHQNVVIVALANKLLRMAWAVLCKNEVYRAPVLAN
jgi:transposase